MAKAIINSNKAYCPVCEEHDYRIISYVEEYTGASKYCRIEARCKKCDENFNYNYRCTNMKDERF